MVSNSFNNIDSPLVNPSKQCIWRVKNKKFRGIKKVLMITYDPFRSEVGENPKSAHAHPVSRSSADLLAEDRIYRVLQIFMDEKNYNKKFKFILET